MSACTNGHDVAIDKNSADFKVENGILKIKCAVCESQGKDVWVDSGSARTINVLNINTLGGINFFTKEMCYEILKNYSKYIKQSGVTTDKKYMTLSALKGFVTDVFTGDAGVTIECKGSTNDNYYPVEAEISIEGKVYETFTPSGPDDTTGPVIKYDGKDYTSKTIIDTLEGETSKRYDFGITDTSGVKSVTAFYNGETSNLTPLVNANLDTMMYSYNVRFTSSELNQTKEIRITATDNNKNESSVTLRVTYTLKQDNNANIRYKGRNYAGFILPLDNFGTYTFQIYHNDKTISSVTCEGATSVKKDTNNDNQYSITFSTSDNQPGNSYTIRAYISGGQSFWCTVQIN